MQSNLTGWRPLAWPVIAPVLLYLILTLSGASFSSIGIGELRENPESPDGVMLGDARAIRSDEWLTGTPFNLRVLATGETEDRNPLTAPEGFLSGQPAGPVSSVVLFDATLQRLAHAASDSILYSARVWLPFLLLALAAPPWFRYVTGSRRMGWFAAALITLSPVTAWWSFIPVAILGPALAGAVALIMTTRAWTSGNPARAVGLGLLSVLLLARSPFNYQPWVIVLVPAVLAVTSLSLVVPRRTRKKAATVVGAVGLVTATVVGVALLENRAALEAVSGTIYPGDRVATGSPNTFQLLFGATNLSVLTENPGLTGPNQSELASSFTVALVWCVLLLASVGRTRSPAQRSGVVAIMLVTGVWLAWCTVAMGTVGAAIPLLNIVPSVRAAQVLGILTVIALCLVLPRLPDRPPIRLALVSAVTAAAISGYAGSLLRQENVPGLSLTAIWLSAIVVAVIVFVITWRPRRWWGYAAGVLAAGSMVWNVNPLLFGLADLRESEIAGELLPIGEGDRRADELWVSDTYATDTLLAATGVPALSGRQISGPDRQAWEGLDPGREHQDVWNRGGAFIWFQWTDDATLTWSNPSDDVILMTGSPCTVAELEEDLTSVISSHPLELPCLTATDTFGWGGVARYVYAVRR